MRLFAIYCTWKRGGGGGEHTHASQDGQNADVKLAAQLPLSNVIDDAGRVLELLMAGRAADVLPNLGVILAELRVLLGGVFRSHLCRYLSCLGRRWGGGGNNGVKKKLRVLSKLLRRGGSELSKEPQEGGREREEGRGACHESRDIEDKEIKRDDRVLVLQQWAVQ